MTSLQPDSELQDEFARRKTRQYLLTIPMILVIFGIRWLAETTSDTILGIPTAVAGVLLFAMIAAAVAFSLINWRCPKCNKYLGKAWSPKFCPSCGFQLSRP